MSRFLCVHGHFYQPPRENPWLEAVELQDSAHPYHDWNERIADECYSSNALSRVLDDHRHIRRVVNNYERISFNFGPTLLSWLEDREPDTYKAILQAARESRHRFSGHSNALAQAYNHIILPLASSADKKTQILWGIRDYRYRFGFDPEGMWLSETAVDLESLELMAEAGLRFTVLSPHQAIRVRPLSGGGWDDVTGGRIDPTMPYLVRLRSGRTISLFFYDGPISRALAFEDLLTNGEHLANRLTSAFSSSRPQLVHIATDGETYGHHRRYGDMGLAYALDSIESSGSARLTNYGEFLALHPPTHEVEIYENSSWSCVHGVERWRSDCGCNSGLHAGWRQHWRAPLRRALDFLRDAVIPLFQRDGAEFFKDPWAARNDYISIILERTESAITRFLKKHAAHPLTDEEVVSALKLLECQRHALLMYTSCGWFFDDLAGIETIQVVMYAGRMLQLAEEMHGEPLEEAFLEKLSEAHSNNQVMGNGREIYQRSVRPAIVDLRRVAAHYAISTLFDPVPDTAAVFSHTAFREEHKLLESGRARLALGRVRIESSITFESAVFSYGVLHLGDHNIYGGVRESKRDGRFDSLFDETIRLFQRAELPEIILSVNRNFSGDATFSLRSLFRDEQRRVVSRLIGDALADSLALNRNFYGQYGPLIRFLTDINYPVPKPLRAAAHFTLQQDLADALAQPVDPRNVADLLDQLASAGLEIDESAAGRSLAKALESAASAMLDRRGETAAVARLEKIAAHIAVLPFPVNLWRSQNCFLEALRESRASKRSHSPEWAAAASRAGLALNFSPEFLSELLDRPNLPYSV
jgi:alpha-amylase/alpha-mannosidase (GH57 family)